MNGTNLKLLLCFTNLVLLFCHNKILLIYKQSFKIIFFNTYINLLLLDTFFVYSFVKNEFTKILKIFNACNNLFLYLCQLCQN